jgi:hypothetical protein
MKKVSAFFLVQKGKKKKRQVKYDIASVPVNDKRQKRFPSPQPPCSQGEKGSLKLKTEIFS